MQDHSTDAADSPGYVSSPRTPRSHELHRIRIVIPVYNDWDSLQILLRELDSVASSLPIAVFVSAVNDGSSDDAIVGLGDLSYLRSLAGIEVLHLAANVGHQRAIAIGLCVAAEDGDADAVLIMDADGEDPPNLIAKLFERVGARESFCFVAQRRKRQESSSFRISYIAYKGLFRIVTGKAISFGNFSLVSLDNVRRLVMTPDLWNNFPAAILRSRVRFETVPLDRGVRYTGTSKMNFTSLVVHGLSGLSVYADTVFVRLILLTLVLILLVIPTIPIVIGLRVFLPAHATPGWATTVVSGAVVILLLVSLTSLSSILMLLNSRVQRLFLPIVDFKPFLATRELLVGQRMTANPLGWQTPKQGQGI